MTNRYPFGRAVRRKRIVTDIPEPNPPQAANILSLGERREGIGTPHQ